MTMHTLEWIADLPLPFGTAPVWHAAREESLRILQVVKLGQELDVAAVKTVVKACVDSILSNP